MLEIKIFTAVFGLIGIVFLGFYIPEHYRDQGRDEVRAEYAERVRLAIVKRDAENAQQKLDQLEINRKVVAKYEAKLKEQSANFDLRVADAKRDGGLRFSTDCRGFTCSANTKSTTGSNETVWDRLPIRIEDGLFEIARKADAVNTQLGACQAWIKDNGFSE
jgi:hypothetical protein